jgi:hypothetical protein
MFQFLVLLEMLLTEDISIFIVIIKASYKFHQPVYPRGQKNRRALCEFHKNEADFIRSEMLHICINRKTYQGINQCRQILI